MKQTVGPAIYFHFFLKKGPSSLLYRSWNCTGRRPISNRAPLPYSSTRALHCLWRERRMACVRASGAVKSCRSARIRACDSHTPYVTYQRQPFEGASSINRKKNKKKMCAGSHTAPAETTSNDSSAMSQPQNRRKCPFSDFRDGTIFDSMWKNIARLSLHTHDRHSTYEILLAHTHTQTTFVCVPPSMAIQWWTFFFFYIVKTLFLLSSFSFQLFSFSY